MWRLEDIIEIFYKKCCLYRIFSHEISPDTHIGGSHSIIKKGQKITHPRSFKYSMAILWKMLVVHTVSLNFLSLNLICDWQNHTCFELRDFPQPVHAKCNLLIIWTYQKFFQNVIMSYLKIREKKCKIR